MFGYVEYICWQMASKKAAEPQKSIRVVVDRTFTDKEIVLMRMLIDGSSREEIAIVLQKSKRTIEAKIDRLRKEFQCKSVVHLAAFFLRNKLIE